MPRGQGSDNEDKNQKDKRNVSLTQGLTVKYQKHNDTMLTAAKNTEGDKVISFYQLRYLLRQNYCSAVQPTSFPYKCRTKRAKPELFSPIFFHSIMWRETSAKLRGFGTHFMKQFLKYISRQNYYQAHSGTVKYLRS